MSISEESGRCLHCKNPLCKTGCPVGYDIPEFLELAGRGENGKAVATVGHLFGEVCGYICLHINYYTTYSIRFQDIFCNFLNFAAFSKNRIAKNKIL